MPPQDRARMNALPPGQTRINNILKWGTEHSAITRSIPLLDANRWTLRIDGAVEIPVRLSWATLLQYPSITTISDFHCVEGWSVVACEWTGIAFTEIVQRFRPKP